MKEHLQQCARPVPFAIYCLQCGERMKALTHKYYCSKCGTTRTPKQLGMGKVVKEKL